MVLSLEHVPLDDSVCRKWIEDIENIMDRIESKSIVNALLMQSSISFIFKLKKISPWDRD